MSAHERPVQFAKERSVVFSVWKFSRLAVVALVLAVALTATGCAKRATVKGKATVDGKPLTSGSIRFVPDTKKGNESPDEPIGTITESGTYELFTKNEAGAPPGFYKVVVNAQETPDIKKPGATKSLIHDKYSKVETTDLSIEVKSGAGADAYDLKLDGPGSGPSGTVPMPK
jgi:hypothetical protein